MILDGFFLSFFPTFFLQLALGHSSHSVDGARAGASRVDSSESENPCRATEHAEASPAALRHELQDAHDEEATLRLQLSTINEMKMLWPTK